MYMNDGKLFVENKNELDVPMQSWKFQPRYRNKI